MTQWAENGTESSYFLVARIISKSPNREQHNPACFRKKKEKEMFEPAVGF